MNAKLNFASPSSTLAVAAAARQLARPPFGSKA